MVHREAVSRFGARVQSRRSRNWGRVGVRYVINMETWMLLEGFAAVPEHRHVQGCGEALPGNLGTKRPQISAGFDPSISKNEARDMGKGAKERVVGGG